MAPLASANPNYPGGKYIAFRHSTSPILSTPVPLFSASEAFLCVRFLVPAKNSIGLLIRSMANPGRICFKVSCHLGKGPGTQHVPSPFPLDPTFPPVHDRSFQPVQVNLALYRHCLTKKKFLPSPAKSISSSFDQTLATLATKSMFLDFWQQKACS